MHSVIFFFFFHCSQSYDHDGLQPPLELDITGMPCIARVIIPSTPIGLCTFSRRACALVLPLCHGKLNTSRSSYDEHHSPLLPLFHFYAKVKNKFFIFLLISLSDIYLKTNFTLSAESFKAFFVFIFVPTKAVCIRYVACLKVEAKCFVLNRKVSVLLSFALSTVLVGY